MSSEPVLHEDVEVQLMNYSHCKLPEYTLPRHYDISVRNGYSCKIGFLVSTLHKHIPERPCGYVYTWIYQEQAPEMTHHSNGLIAPDTGEFTEDL